MSNQQKKLDNDYTFSSPLMTKANDIKRLLNLVDTIESYTLQAYQDNMRLSENLHNYEEKSLNKPPFSINYLELYDARETVTSKIIRHIFAYSYDGHHPFLESFAATFLQEIGFKTEWINTPEIDKNHEYRGIDILVRDKQYALIIENKLKGADFQPNQLARYIATMRNEGYSDEEIYIIVLPIDNKCNEELRESVWKLPKDWQHTSKNRKCRVNAYNCWCDTDDEDYQSKSHCQRCESLREIFEKRTLFIHKELSKWLYECVAFNTIGIPKDELHKQYVLTSAVLQFVDFLNFLYKTRENDKYKMDIQNFLSKHLKLDEVDDVEQLSLVEDKIDEVEELKNRLEELHKNKVEKYINKISNKYLIHIAREDKNDCAFYYKLKFNKTSVTITLSNDNDGPFCIIETDNNRKIPEIIRNDFIINEELNDNTDRNNCIWKYDSYKESLLRFERVLGRLLELKDKS